MRLLQAELTKRNFVKLKFKTVEVGINGIDDASNPKTSKEYDKIAHRHLVDAFYRFSPHLLFQTQLIDDKVAIPADTEPEEWFQKFKFKEDKRFDGVRVTMIKTFGKETVEGIQILGFKENESGDVCPLKTGVIYWDREDPNHYALNHIVQAAYETLEFEVEEYDKGKNEKTTTQIEMFS